MTNSSAAQVYRAVVENPLPQSQTTSCQSYGIAFNLAYRFPGLYSVATAAELRTLEEKVRAAILTAGGAGNEYYWSSWKSAVAQLSNGELMLVEERFKNETELLERLAKLTGNGSNVAAGSIAPLLRLTTHIPVMLSMTVVDSWHYSGGHIVTVLGASEHPVSPRPLLILNPAAKTSAGDRNMCSPFDTITDQIPWSSSVSRLAKYKIKHFALLCVRAASTGTNPKCE